jgi:hypothetical protein
MILEYVIAITKRDKGKKEKKEKGFQQPVIYNQSIGSEIG